MTRRLACLASLAPARVSKRIKIIAHRGHHTALPENSLAAIASALRLGCDYVEIDVRTTRDGAFILHHDATHAGRPIEDWARADLQRADPNIPTLDDALALFRNKGAVYFDGKQISASEIINALERHRLLQRAVVYGRPALLDDLTKQGHPQLAMPEAVSVDAINAHLKNLKPKVIAFDRRDFQPEIIAVAQQAGVGLFVDRLGPDDTPAAWLDAIAKGATGIQTDKPDELLKTL